MNSVGNCGPLVKRLLKVFCRIEKNFLSMACDSINGIDEDAIDSGPAFRLPVFKWSALNPYGQSNVLMPDAMHPVSGRPQVSGLAVCTCLTT